MTPQRAFDDREHRRGLVLGLTMAEVLLLLLFLLLLALGARLSQLAHAVETEKTLRVQLETDLSALRYIRDLLVQESGESRESVEMLVRQIGELTNLRRENSELRESIEAMVSDQADLQALAAVIDKARAIDPKEPVALLTRALFDFAATRIRLRGSALEDASAASVADLAIEAHELRQEPGSKSDHNWPPIIRLSEADGHFFESGKAELQPEFQAALNDSVADELLDIIERYDVDVIEVIGHTDEQPLAARPSNLDGTLIGALHGTADPSLLVPADNAGLGMARATAVARVLLANERLNKYRILPLSGAQVIDIGDTLSDGNLGDIQERRRIEIRVRRSTSALEPT